MIIITFDVINYQSDTLTSFVLQVIVILRKDCALGSTHQIFWKMSLIGRGAVVQHQVILQDHQLITQQEQRKVGTFSYIFVFLLSLHLFEISSCNVQCMFSLSWLSAFGSGVQ